MYQKVLDNYKVAIVISFFILAGIVTSLLTTYATTGDFVSKGLDFKGGTQITVNGIDGDLDVLRSVIEEELGPSARLRTISNGQSIILESTESVSKDRFIEMLNSAEIGYESDTISRSEIGASLSNSFLKQAIRAAIIAFVAMAIVVFITFRTVVPSLAVMIAGVSDILAAIVGMNLLGIELTLSTLAALLILIGYSVDTDILLSTRVLKNKSMGTLDERITASMKTGMTMTLTAIAAMVVLFIVSTSKALDDIALVILLGLIADIPFTWLQNAGILKWYAIKKNIK